MYALHILSYHEVRVRRVVDEWSWVRPNSGCLVHLSHARKKLLGWRELLRNRRTGVGLNTEKQVSLVNAVPAQRLVRLRHLRLRDLKHHVNHIKSY
jgi:hypothetical protein